jgi:hypothetical protein
VLAPLMSDVLNEEVGNYRKVHVHGAFRCYIKLSVNRGRSSWLASLVSAEVVHRSLQ